MATEAGAITLFALIMMALAPMIAAFIAPSGRTIMMIVAAGGWALTGFYAYDSSTETWDVLYGLFWFAMFMVIACIFVPAVLRERKEHDISMDDVDGKYNKYDHMGEAEDKDRQNIERVLGNKTTIKKHKQKRTVFEQKGEL